MEYKTASELYNRLLDNEVSFIEFMDYLSKRESESWDRGYNSAKNLYEPLLFSDKVEV